MNRSSLRLAAFVALSALALIGCDDPVGPQPTPVASVSILPAPEFVEIGQQILLEAKPKAANGVVLDRPVSWESDNVSVASVSATGVVTPRAEGEVGIKAISERRSGFIRLRVRPRPRVPVAEVRLSEDNEVLLEWNGTKTLTATALDAQGNVLPGRGVTWSSNRPSIATVANGVITAVAAGAATITAVIEGVPSSISVRVSAPPIVDIFIEGPTGLEVGEATQFAARVRRASGPDMYEQAMWTSSNPAVAQVTHIGACCTVVEVLSVGQVMLTVEKEGVTRSVTLVATPRVSHDLIYDRWTGASEIFTMSLLEDGHNPVRVNAGNVSRDPSPSPDGTQLVFAVSQIDAMGQPQNDLFIVNRNGLNMRWLTRMPGMEDAPEWSPDGTKILFSYSGPQGEGNDIYTINPDGTGLTNVTAALPATMGKRDPRWSPDSRRIAFIGIENSQYKVWTIGVDGTAAMKVTTDVGFDQAPTWSPAGDRIAFVRHNTTNHAYGDDIMIVAASGGTPVRLALPGHQRTPAWSPDGHYIAVSGTTTTNQAVQEIYTLRPDGTGLKLRTVNPAWGGGTNPAWLKRQ